MAAQGPQPGRRRDGRGARGLRGLSAGAPGLASFPAAFDARRLDERPAGAVWSGPDLLRAALARNPQVIEARRRYLTAVAAVRAARVAPGTPVLALTAEYANETPHWGYTAAAEVPLESGTLRTVRITAAELQALLALYDYGEVAWSVRTALEKARIGLSAAEAEVRLADEAADWRRRRFERLQQRVAAGEDASFTALTAQAEAAAAGRRAVEARGRRNAARIALAAALGVSEAAVQGLSTEPAPETPSLADLARWRHEAALSRRDVLRAVADYDLAENALRAEVARQHPQVRLGPAYNYDHGITKLPFSVALQLPPRDLNRAAIDQAEAARTAAGRTLEAAQAKVLAEVDAAADALAAASASREQVRADLATARRTLAAADRALRAGESDRVDELGARAAEAEARLALGEAEHAAARASAELENALRRPFDLGEAPVLEAAITRPGAAP